MSGATGVGGERGRLAVERIDTLLPDEQPTNESQSPPAKPYVGSSPFGLSDVPLFAGRDEIVEQYACKLAWRETRILILHGPRRSGKTSLVRAGLAPLLERDYGYQFIRSGTTDYLSSLSPIPNRAFDPLRRVYSPLPPSLKALGQQRTLSISLSPKMVVEDLRKIASLNADRVALAFDAGLTQLETYPQLLEFLAEFSALRFPCKLILVLSDEAARALKDPLLKRVTECIAQANGEDAKRIHANERVVFESVPREVSESTLVQAIQRPTMLKGVSWGFAYEENLPAAIAKDILGHQTPWGPLWTMQFVGLALWHAVGRTGQVEKNLYETKPLGAWMFRGAVYSVLGAVESTQIDQWERWADQARCSNNGAPLPNDPSKNKVKYRLLDEEIIKKDDAKGLELSDWFKKTYPLAEISSKPSVVPPAESGVRPSNPDGDGAEQALLDGSTGDRR